MEPKVGVMAVIRLNGCAFLRGFGGKIIKPRLRFVTTGLRDEAAAYRFFHSRRSLRQRRDLRRHRGFADA